MHRPTGFGDQMQLLSSQPSCGGAPKGAVRTQLQYCTVQYSAVQYSCSTMQASLTILCMRAASHHLIRQEQSATSACRLFAMRPDECDRRYSLQTTYGYCELSYAGRISGLRCRETRPIVDPACRKSVGGPERSPYPSPGSRVPATRSALPLSEPAKDRLLVAGF